MDNLDTAAINYIFVNRAVAPNKFRGGHHLPVLSLNSKPNNSTMHSDLILPVGCSIGTVVISSGARFKHQSCKISMHSLLYHSKIVKSILV